MMHIFFFSEFNSVLRQISYQSPAKSCILGMSFSHLSQPFKIWFVMGIARPRMKLNISDP